MKVKVKSLMIVLATLVGMSAFAAAEIQCVVDGSSGEYCGDGYGITVNVSTPASGYTIKYAESESGPWLDELKYVNVCTDKPIYYQVTATGYATKTGSAKVTVTPKELTNDYIWLVLPTGGYYVYDGDPKEPEVAAYDGDPSILTEDDWEVSFENNTDAGTATATFTGKGNYTGECYEDFEIVKADNEWTTEPSIADWTYGQTPSTPVSAAKVGTATVTYSSGSVPTMPGDYTATFTVAESDNYNELSATVDFKVLPATIQCVVDGSEGEYCGEGYGITVNVSTPASGYTIKYAENEGGPWLDEIKYVNVCTDKTIYYQVTATGYNTKVDSAKVTVTPKELTNDYIWLVLPTGGYYVYDGDAKEPEVAAYDGDPSILTEDDWEVSFENNTDAGTATATFTGKGNYTGECYEDFEIVKADITDGGGEPGGGVVPPGGKSKFDATYEYDGQPHTIKTDELTAAFIAQFTGKGVAAPSGFKYSTDWNGTDGTWVDSAPTFINVVVTGFWYKVCSADSNYDDYIHEAKLTITPRDIAKATVADIPDQEHTGTAIKPPVTVIDGNPTIITSDDYTVAYSDNIAIGQATVTLTGKRNYTGTKTVHFMIKGSSAAALKAEIAWKLLKASGTYMAQLKVTCTSGLTTGISNLRFMFADRVSGGTTFASLWDTPKRAAKSTTMPYSGDTYRYVALDASRITAENVAVTYGVSNLAATSIPTAERTIELYVRKRVNPTTGKEEAAGVDNFVGYLSWTSGGETSYLPIVAGAQAASFSKAALRARAPMKLAAVNTALAVGSVIAEGSSPYCKLTEFAVGDNEITGVVEVGAVSSDGAEYPGKLGPNATVTLLGTNDLGLDFKAICSVTTDSAGRFRLVQPKDCQFFKLKLTVEEVVE